MLLSPLPQLFLHSPSSPLHSSLFLALSLSLPLLLMNFFITKSPFPLGFLLLLSVKSPGLFVLQNIPSSPIITQTTFSYTAPSLPFLASSLHTSSTFSKFLLFPYLHQTLLPLTFPCSFPLPNHSLSSPCQFSSLLPLLFNLPFQTCTHVSSFPLPHSFPLFLSHTLFLTLTHSLIHFLSPLTHIM